MSLLASLYVLVEYVQKEFICRLGSSQVEIVVKKLLANAGDLRDTGLIPGSGRCPEGGRSSLLQYSCLGNPINRGAWRATALGAAKS